MNLKSIVITGILLTNSVTAREVKDIPTLEKNDFTYAKEITKMGKSVLAIELTPSGVAKTKATKEKVRFKIGKNTYRFKLKEKRNEDQLILGPFSYSEAIKIKKEINQ